MSLTSNRLMTASSTGGFDMPQGNFFWEGGSPIVNFLSNSEINLFIPEDFHGLYTIQNERLYFQPFNTPGDVTSGLDATAEELSNNLSLGSFNDITGLVFNSAGTKAIAVNEAFDLFEISLSTAWDVTTASKIDTIDLDTLGLIYKSTSNYAVGLHISGQYMYIGTGPQNAGSGTGESVSTNVVKFTDPFNLSTTKTKASITSGGAFFPYRNGFTMGNPGAGGGYTYGFGVPIPGSEFTYSGVNYHSVLSAYGDLAVMPVTDEMLWYTNQVNSDNFSSHRLIENSYSYYGDISGTPFYFPSGTHIARMVQGSGTSPDYLYIFSRVPIQKVYRTLGVSSFSINKVRIEKHAEDASGNWNRKYMQWSGSGGNVTSVQATLNNLIYARRYKNPIAVDYNGYGAMQCVSGSNFTSARTVVSSTWTNQYGRGGFSPGFGTISTVNVSTAFPSGQYGRGICFAKKLNVTGENDRYVLGISSTSSTESSNGYATARFWQFRRVKGVSDSDRDMASLAGYSRATNSYSFASGSDFDTLLSGKYIVGMGCGGIYSPGKFLMWIMRMDQIPALTITPQGTSFDIATFVWEPDSTNSDSGNFTFLDSYSFQSSYLQLPQVGLVCLPGGFHFSDNGRRCWLTAKADIMDPEYSQTTEIKKFITMQMDLREPWKLETALDFKKQFKSNVLNFYNEENMPNGIADHEYGMGIVALDEAQNAAIVMGGSTSGTTQYFNIIGRIEF